MAVYPVTVTEASAWSDNWSCQQGPFANGSDLFVFGVDKTNNRVRAYRSQDAGATWAEVDSGTTRACSTTAADKSVDCVRSGATVYAGVVLSGTSIAVYVFDLASAAWGTTITGPTITVNHVTGTSNGRPLTLALAASGTEYLVALYSGATESVMGTAYHRVKFHVRDLGAGTWAGPFDLVGSANSPLANTLPGTQVHYTTQTACGIGARAHLGYMVNAVLLQRVWQAASNALTTVATVVASSQALPTFGAFGRGAAYTRAAATGIAIPFSTDTGATLVPPDGIAVARCDDHTGAETAANWGLEGALTSPGPADLTGARVGPGAALADDEKLWLWGITSGQEVVYASDDGGAGAWSETVFWKRGEATHCAGLSAGAVSEGLGVAYHDTLGAPAQTQLVVDRMIDLGHTTGAGGSQAQAFRFASARTLKGVRVRAHRTGVTTSLLVQVRADASGLPHATTALASGVAYNYTLPLDPAPSRWVTVFFTTPVALSAATRYWLVVKLQGVGDVDAANFYRVGASSSDVYAGDLRAVGDNSSSTITWTAQAAGDGDLAFLLYTTEDSPARLRYDRVVVLQPVTLRSAGTTTGAWVDLGEAPPASIEVAVDVGAGGDPAGSVEVEVQGSWDQGAVTPLANAGPYDQMGVSERIRLEAPPRYLRAVTVTATAASAAGASGVEAEDASEDEG